MKLLASGYNEDWKHGRIEGGNELNARHLKRMERNKSASQKESWPSWVFLGDEKDGLCKPRTVKKYSSRAVAFAVMSLSRAHVAMAYIHM